MIETQTHQSSFRNRVMTDRVMNEVDEKLEEKTPNYSLRRKVAAGVAGVIIAPFVAKGFADSHNQYGYHPVQQGNTPAETANK